MDQPHNENDEQNKEQNLTENNSTEGVSSEQNVDTTPYQDETPFDAMNDPMDGMQAAPSEYSAPVDIPAPESVLETPEQHEEAIETAEEQVAEAHPQAASDELASVASELQAMESQNFDAEATPMPSTEGIDPMVQIAEDEAASTPEPAVFNPPAEEVAVEPAFVEPPTEQVLSSEPTFSESASPLREEPASMSGEMSSSEPASEPIMSSPETQGGQMINDVIAPSSTAVAAAAGTMGSNAITGTPETTTTDAAIAAGSAPKPAAPKSKKGILILIVVLVTLLFGGAAVAAYMSSPNKTEDSNTSDSSSPLTTADARETEAQQPTASPGEEVDAATLDDYKVVCGGEGKVLNASDYMGVAVHPIVMFEKGSDDKFAQNILAFKDKTWTPDTSKVTTGQLVGCISRTVASEKKLKSCPITDPATKVTVNVDYYSSSYMVDVYEAKTGKIIGSFDTVSTAAECPIAATYDKSDPKIFAKYDLATLEALLKEYVTKAL